ncbi:MAG: hypothetical protein GX458_20800 [Phyllobacteriaceae bacterium]|nr:hypothetical protein [Phyllobacteriaceae bacterium]
MKAAARGLYVAAMREQIAATLDRRDYDVSRLGPAIVAASVENAAALGASVDRAAEASRRSEHEGTGAARFGAVGARP